MISGSPFLLAFAAQLAGAGALALSRPDGAGGARVYIGAALFFAGCAALFGLALTERNFLLAGAELAAIIILVLMLRRGPGQENASGQRAGRGRSRPAKRGITRDLEQKH